MNHSVNFTGHIFANQRFGGVSRYVVELVSALDAETEWSPWITAPLHVNEYLRDASFRSAHRGLYLRYRPPGLISINRFLKSLGRFSARGPATLTHEVLYDHQNLRNTEGFKVATFYDMIHERFMPDDQLLERKKLTFECSDRVIAISEATKTDMVHYLGVPDDKIDVVYLASNMEPNLDRVKLVPDGDYVLWVGPRRGYKNFETFAQGLAKSRAWQGGFRLVCAGGPEPGDAERTSWKELGLAPDRVLHCRPSEPELASLYSHATLLVYASKYEGFGIPPLEAMNCRCPLAASTAGSIPEVVGDAGLAFDPEAADAIMDVIDRIAESPTLQDELAERGVERAKRFSWGRCATETTAMYSRIIGEQIGVSAAS